MSGPTSARTGVLLFGLDIKIAGTLSLVVSLPTMLVAFSRYGQDARFAVLRHNMPFVLIMATGSIVGTVLGGLLLGVVPSTVLIPILAALLLISAVKVWRHWSKTRSPRVRLTTVSISVNIDVCRSRSCR